jgi:uncharacterized protein (DUF58 family)
VFISDFMGDIKRVETSLSTAMSRGVRGALVQVLDPAEQAFPYDGRSIFTANGSKHQFETNKASGLRDDYLGRLAERQDILSHMAQNAGWTFTTHVTDQPAQAVLVWLYTVLEQRGHA